MDKAKHEQVTFTVDTMGEDEYREQYLMGLFGKYYEMFLDMKKRLPETPDNVWLIYRLESCDEGTLMSIVKSLGYAFHSAEWHKPPYEILTEVKDGGLWIKRNPAWSAKQDKNGDA